MTNTVSQETAKDSRASGTSWEVADIFRILGPDYVRTHPLPLSHLKVIRAITSCRTAALGGHLQRCDTCGFERPAYNSCRNRHCPKCQMMAKARWLHQREAELLPVDYFHTVFTIPHEMNSIALCNKKAIFDILFQSVAKTLKEFAADPRHGLAGRIGFMAILHTWDQQLGDHIHLHCLIPGGVLSFDENNWISAPKNFLFPVKALSRVFRGKFIEALKHAFAQGQLTFPGKTAEFATDQGFASLLASLWQKEWVVYSKKPFAGPEKVLDYLGRYTHRVAIANHRIISVKADMVTFTYRDRRKQNMLRSKTLPAEEFIRRFLLHVLPESYVRIRHFGFLANRCKHRCLSRCRELLGQPAASSETQEMTTKELMHHLTGVDLERCPHCGRGRMQTVEELPARALPLRFVTEGFSPEPIDSS